MGKKNLRNFFEIFNIRIINFKFLFLTYIFVFLGAVLVFDASSAYSIEYFNSPYYFFIKQFFWILIGTVVLVIFTFIVDYWDLKSIGLSILIFSILLLILVYVPGIGRKVNNASRWIKIWKFNFQPAEFVKILWIIYLSDFFDRNRSKIKDFKIIAGPLIILLVLSLLIYKQPDFGTVIILVFSFIYMLFVAGYPVKYLFLMLVLFSFFSYFAVFKVGYRFERLLAFLNPFEYSKGNAWQLVQSLIALGSGGIFGKGIAASQSKLFYLPYAHTDFIFPIFGEEYGFFGSFILILLYILFIYEGVRISLNSPNYFSKLLSSGLVFIIGLHAVLNIAIACGLLPTKGMTLPFLSSGGSSLVSNMFAVGVVLNISIYGKKKNNYF